MATGDPKPSCQVGCFLHLLPITYQCLLQERGLRFHIPGRLLRQRASPGKRAHAAGGPGTAQSTSRDALQPWELAGQRSCPTEVCKSGSLRGTSEAASILSWRGGRLEEIGEGIQSSRGWGSKQRCKRRVQAVVNGLAHAR